MLGEVTRLSERVPLTFYRDLHALESRAGSQGGEAEIFLTSTYACAIHLRVMLICDLFAIANLVVSCDNFILIE